MSWRDPQPQDYQLPRRRAEEKVVKWYQQPATRTDYTLGFCLIMAAILCLGSYALGLLHAETAAMIAK